jgi:hypothetical protein
VVGGGIKDIIEAAATTMAARRRAPTERTRAAVTRIADSRSRVRTRHLAAGTF